MIKARDLHRTFAAADGGEIHVLRGVELAVPAGDAVAIVGPSGSGKSTLLHLLGALDRATSGDVWLGDRRIADLDDVTLAALRNRYVGFVFQFHHLLRDFTAVKPARSSFSSRWSWWSEHTTALASSRAASSSA